MTRFFVRSAGSRFHVVDDATGYVVAGHWSHWAAFADASARNGVTSVSFAAVPVPGDTAALRTALASLASLAS